MSKGVLEFAGLRFDERSNEEKAYFMKKDKSGVWGLGKGNVDWSQFQPRTPLFVEWDNWVAMSATTNIPAGGGKRGYTPQPYHLETFVSNICGQAIQAGLIKDPKDLPAWAKTAALTIKAAKALLEGEAPLGEAPPDTPKAPFEDPIPF